MREYVKNVRRYYGELHSYEELKDALCRCEFHPPMFPQERDILFVFSRYEDLIFVVFRVDEEIFTTTIHYLPDEGFISGWDPVRATFELLEWGETPELSEGAPIAKAALRRIMREEV